MVNSIVNLSKDCPKCGKEMVIKKQDNSHDTRNKKEYDRVVYWCEVDDIWVSIEIPK